MQKQWGGSEAFARRLHVLQNLQVLKTPLRGFLMSFLSLRSKIVTVFTRVFVVKLLHFAVLDY